MRRLLMLAVLALAAASCSEEEATPVDIGSGSATTAPTGEAGTAAGQVEPGSLPPTPHAVGENPQARAHAERQCLTDPSKEQGVVRIVDPTNDVVVGEVIVDCAEVRAADDPGSTTTDS